MRPKHVLLLLLLFCFFTDIAGERVYTFVPRLNIRSQPSGASAIAGNLNYGRWVKVIDKTGGWTKVILPNKKTGYVSSSLVTNVWIKVLKKERKILLLKDTVVIEEFPIALGFNPKDDKIQQGDVCTPEGRFYICEMLPNPQPKQRYGARSMRLSYPDIEDARRGLKNGLITKAQYIAIVKAVYKGKKPPQNTKLGGSIRIHGGGAGPDWTLGCIALNDEDIIKLYGLLPKNRAMVEVYKSRKSCDEMNTPGYLLRKVEEGSKKLLQTPCKYTKGATAIIPIKFPMGDFDKSTGVCTDVVIRALRYANIDLQALLYEDIIANPGRYKEINKPNTNIDHRRTRNLKIFFDHNAEVLTDETPAKKPEEWKPGDIALFDTGIPNGTVYDHIGIVSRTKVNGAPLVINLWTIGWDLQELDLLQGDYPKIVGHYRLTHLFDYHTIP